MKVDKLIIFDISGSFAHFKKYYTNASSLSYEIPPRTVIAGIIAGILGIERDEYYSMFDLDNTKIGVSIKSAFRKIMQTVNYYNIELKNNSLRYQVPLEILIPRETRESIQYRIYFYNENKFDELCRRIKDKRYVYNPYLGISEFLADIDFVDFISKDKIIKITPDPQEALHINSCFKKNCIREIKIKNNENKSLQYIIERMPVNFINITKKDDNGNFLKDNEDKEILDKRNLHLFDNFIYEQNMNGVYATFNAETEIFQIEYEQRSIRINENIIFM